VFATKALSPQGPLRGHEGYKGVRAYLHAIWAMLLLTVVLLFFANIDRISWFKLDKSGFEAKTREAEKIVSIGGV